MSRFRRAFRAPSPGHRGARRAVDEELSFHLDEMEEELLASGMTPGEAREEALRRFGDMEATRDYCVDQQTRLGTREGWTVWIEQLGQDMAYTLRTLRGSRGYAVVVVLTLAAGIAASTVVFSLINPYFLRPLPYADADELVQLGLVDPRYDWDGARFSHAMVDDYTSRASSLQAVGLYHYGHTNVTGPEGPERVQVGRLSENMFEVLGATAARGRTFADGEGGPGGADVVVVDWGLWQRRWAADPDILGRSLSLDGIPHTVIGVMPPDFTFPFGGVKLWVPLRSTAANESRGDAGHLPVARLAPGWTPAAARTELEGIHAELAERFPDVDGVFTGVSVKPIREALNFAWDVLRLGFTVLLGAVLFVLAIACVNVASLTLARARSRRREVAVRAAIGAGRSRIVRQLAAESLVLAIAGGALGVLLAYGVVGSVAPMVPEDLYRVGEVSVDRTVLAFTALVTLLTPLAFGLMPALRVARTPLATSLREGRGGGDGGGSRGRRVLVVAELALAVVLVTGTGLMIRSFSEIQSVELGFDADRLLTVEVTPPQSDYLGVAEIEAYFARAAEELEALPGVETVGQVYPLPLNHETLPLAFSVPGMGPAADSEQWPTALWASVTPGYFDAMGIPFLAGGTFDGSETRDGPPVVVVSRSLAERHFPDGQAVGRPLELVLGDSVASATVIGVVGSVVHSGFAEAGADMHLYQPQSQSPRRRRFLVVRSRDDPASVAASARRAILDVDPNLPAAIRPMDEIVLENSYQWSVSSLFLGVFGLAAVLLASLGVYGVVSYSVALRRRELGVRMAMGARPGEIRRMVLGDGLRLTALGGGLGILAALGLGRLIESLLFGVSASDPWTLAGVVVLFALLALGASLLPARRATRLDPVQVLRAE